MPGLGSYIQTATYAGDVRALLAGIVTVILIVVATDQLVWRPLIAWSDKFKFEQVESAEQVTSPILELLRRSQDRSDCFRPRSGIASRSLSVRHAAQSKECRVVRPLDEDRPRKSRSVLWAVALVAAMAVCWAAAQAALMLRTITWADLRLLLEGAAATFLRVNASLRHLRRVDHSCRRGHRPQPAAGAHRAAAGADHGVGAGNGVLSDFAHGAGAHGRRPGHRVDLL